MKLQGKKIFLRTLLPTDADILFQWENDKANWAVSGTKKPFTKKEIEEFIADQKDIYLDKQLRLMICTSKNKIGCIDLFEFDPTELKAGVGILIGKEHRKQGYASEALSLLIKYCFEVLNLLQLYCHIMESNTASLKLFQKLKFSITGKEKDTYRLELLK